MRRFRILTAGMLLALSLVLGGCQSQTAALQQELKTTEAVDTTAEENSSTGVTAEETALSGTESEQADRYQDASAWTSGSAGGENLDKYKVKVASEETETDTDADTDAEDDETDSEQNYNTDPIPEGKPKPVEPENESVDTDTELTCTLSVECSTILDNMDDLTDGKENLVPSDGVIFKAKQVTFYEGESVFDVLKREMQNHRIHMESEFTAMYNSAYIKGINNLYEFDCGSLSGWMYCVNDWYPNYGCSRYQLEDGDVIEWHYTCDLGRDLGQSVAD